MAIYSAVPPPSQAYPASLSPTPILITPTAPIAVSFATLNISLPTSPSAATQSKAANTGVPLSIPLNSTREDETKTRSSKAPLRRDSMKRREALLRGKEGSRRRQRWENDHLLHVPNAQTPLPSDWQVHSTSPVRNIPYYLAPLWDMGVRIRSEEIASTKKITAAKKAGLGLNDSKGRVPEELKQKLKKSKGAKTLLQELEQEIRSFVREYERNEEKDLKQEGEEEQEMDSEDEEIVFVGRNGGMSDEVREKAVKEIERELLKEKKIFEAEVGDHKAGFGRWLVHNLAGYYGLSSWSVTKGNPERREVRVAIRERDVRERIAGTGGGEFGNGDVGSGLPRPLWGMV